MKTVQEFLKEQEQLDEGILQNVFNYLWTASGKVLDKLPVIGDKRKEERILKHYDNFVARMDDAGTKKFITDLTSKIKSSHHATVKASTHRATVLERQIANVKKSENAKQYIQRMNIMNKTLRDLEKFVKTSNKRTNAK